MRRGVAIAIIGLASLAAPVLRAQNLPASQVVVVFNRLAAGSEEVARHYAAARAVPADNLLGFDMPETETITWPQFVSQVWQPLQDRLIQSGWIDAVSEGAIDAVGRKTYRIAGHRILAMVLCRGVPLRVADDRALFVASDDFAKHPELETNAGSVDSELSLLAAARGYPIDGLVTNRLYGRLSPTPRQLLQVVKISRLDGPTVSDAEALVDHAIAGERLGLMGRAYVDMGGRYPDGDRWLQSVTDQIEAAGFSADIDRDPNTLAPWVRFDAPVLYFGWYYSDINGPFVLPGFRFPPGAIAFHIHSFSAQTLRSSSVSWCGPFIARGVTATVGNVWEPYLQYTHRPDLLLAGLMHGLDWVDAVYYSLPALSWAAVAIGDPLYRPFAVGWDVQAEQFDQLPRPWAGYTALRLARVLEAAGQTEQVLPVLQSALKARPSLALGIAVAERLQAAGQPAAAAQVLAPVLLGPVASPGEWGTLAAAAALAQTCGRPDLAKAAYRRLLTMPALPLDLRAHWLVDAGKAAAAAADPAQAERWRRELDQAVAELRKE